MEYPKARFRYKTLTLVKFGSNCHADNTTISYRLRKGVLFSPNYGHESDPRFCLAIALSESILTHLGKTISPKAIMAHIAYEGGQWVKLNGKMMALTEDLARKMGTISLAKAISQAVNECVAKYDPPRPIIVHEEKTPPEPPKKNLFLKGLDLALKVIRFSGIYPPESTLKVQAKE